jgi:hypothetical protein
MLTTAIQVNLGMISLGESEVTKKLAAWAAIIAVPTMVAGIYGMNRVNISFERLLKAVGSFGLKTQRLEMFSDVVGRFLFVFGACSAPFQFIGS